MDKRTLEARALFSSRLSTLMKERNLAQNELAKKLDVAESTVGKWILCKSMPRTMGLVQQIADYFGVAKSFLLEKNADRQGLISVTYPTATEQTVVGFTASPPTILMRAEKELPPDQLKKLEELAGMFLEKYEKEQKP